MKLEKDLNIIEVVRNQKIFVAAINKIMTSLKFQKCIRENYKGNISDTSGHVLGDDTDVYQTEERVGRTLSNLDRIRVTNPQANVTPR